MKYIRNMKKYLKISLLVAISLLVFASCNDTPKDKEHTKKLKVGFITVGPANDWGYNYAHDQGRQFIQQAGADKFETQIVEKIPESAEVERVMERMISEGTTLIFPTSYGYLDPALRVAEKHPDVTFMHCGGFKNAKNLGTYFGYIHEPMYLSGIVAGRMTKTNKLGFVAAFPIPQVLRNINAFTMGARSVNPKVEVHVVWTNNWYDPATEAEATKSLINIGADVLSMHQDSPITVAQTAESNGAMTVGYHADVAQFAPKGWLTGAKWNWGKLYQEIGESVINKTWKNDQLRNGLDSGYVDLASFGAPVPKEVQDEVLAMKSKIASHEYIVFQGPLKDREGNVRLEAGQPVTFDWMEKMDFFVEGVVGSINK